MSVLSPLEIAAPAFWGAIALEALVSRRRRDGRVRLGDTLANLVAGTGNLLTDALWVALAYRAYGFFHAHAIFQIPTHEIWAWILLFFADDFVFYWFHRASHRVRLLWASHVVHHSSELYNLSTAIRQTWTGGAFAWAFWSPLALLGFHPVAILTMQALSLVYQFGLHTGYVGKRRSWVEALLDTPSHHRVHHGRNPEYIDKNYGGVLILWDRLFGTFEPEAAPVEYGITTPFHTWNPLALQLHEFVAIVGDVARGRSPREWLGRVLRGPEWKPASAPLAATAPASRAALPPRSRRSIASLVASALAVLVLAAGVARAGEAYMQDAIAADLVARTARIAGVRGVLEERALVPGAPGEALVTRVVVAADGSARLETLAPAPWRGDVLALAGGTLVLYSRARDAAVRISHVPGLDRAEHARLVRELVRTRVRDYRYEAGEPELVAGRAAVPWHTTPREGARFLAPATTWLDRELAFPLAARVATPRAPLAYEGRYREIALDATIEPREVAFDLPPTASLVSWDLADAPLELGAARKVADFALLEPAPELGLARTRLVRARASWPPQLAATYERGPFVAVVAELADRGLVDEGAPGWRVPLGDGDARVRFAGDWTIATLARAGTVAVVFADLPFADTLELCASLAPRGP